VLLAALAFQYLSLDVSADDVCKQLSVLLSLLSADDRDRDVSREILVYLTQ